MSEEDNELRLFGLSRPLAGALVGVLLFMLIFLLSKISGFMILSTALLAPGIWMSYMLESSTTNEAVSNLIAFLISCIPPAALGSRIISKKKEIRAKGISFFIIYVIFSLLTVLLIFRIALD